MPLRLPFWLPPLFFLLLSSLFLWRSTFAGDVFLPAGLLGHVAPWKGHLGLETLPPWNPLRWDGIAQFYPWRHFAGETVRQGTLPLWNPYQFCGTPFVANSQSAVFYPGNLLFLLLPDTARAFGLSALLHLTLCGWFTYLLLLRLRVSALSALLGGVVFAFSAWQVAWLQLPTFLATSCWFPLLLLMLHRLRDPSPVALLSRLASIGAVVGMLLLAGHLQIAFYGLLMGTIWTVGILWEVRHAEGSRVVLPRLLGAGGGLLVGLLLAAPQLLSSIELSRMSHRVGTPTAAGYALYVEYALPSNHIVTLALPGLFGDDAQPENAYWGFYLKSLPNQPPIPVRHNGAETAAYVGFATLGLGGLALLRGLRRGSIDRRTLFFGGLALLALLLALGTPLNALFYFVIPGFGQSGSPARGLVLWAFAWAMLSAFGLDALRELRPTKREIGLLFGGLLGVLGLGLVLTGMTLTLVPEGAKFIPTLGEALGRILPDWLRLAVVGVGLALLLFVRSRPARPGNGLLRSHAVAWGALLLVVADLFSAGLFANPTAPPSAVYPETAGIRTLRENTGHDRILPLNRRWSLYSAPPAVLPPNAGMVYGLRDVQGYDSLFLGQYKAFANEFALPNAQGGRDASPPEVGNMVFFQNANAANIAALGAAFAVAPPSETAGFDASALPPVSPLPSDDSLTLLPLAHSPRAHLHTPDPAGSVVWEEDGPTRLRLTITASAPNTLDLADTYAPGWEATLDGLPTTITRQQDTPIFRAVAIPSGSHTLTFTYQPVSFRLGLYLACAALALLTATVIYSNAYRITGQIRH